MSRWFRHYAGMVRDDKLVRASIKSKQSIERVVWIWGAVLESAAETDDDGRFEVDSAEIARFLRCKSSAIEVVIKALAELGRIDGDRVSAWSKRQFKSDRSNDRVATHRANKKRDGSGDVTLHVTLPERDGNSPETETDITLAKANGAGAPKVDSDKLFWDNAKDFLRAEVKGDPGSLIGRWIKLHGKAETISAIGRAQVERPVQAVPFIEGCFRQQARHAVSEYGPC